LVEFAPVNTLVAIRKRIYAEVMVLSIGNRLLARKMRGYADAQAGRVFRDLIDMPATVIVSPSEVLVRFHRRAHLPIIIDSGLLNRPVCVPWWNGATLRMVA
jgi:hypothetical protein